MLELTGVQRRHGGRVVLRVDALRLERGEQLGLVGPNGSGKSTLLRLLAFVDAPDAGTIALDGRPVVTAAERRQARRRATLVEQRPFLFRGSVRENVAWGLRARGTGAGEAARAADQALAQLRSAPLADREARGLSEGEIQRVAVARALATGAELLLLDEPTSGADRAAQAALYEAITEARAARPLTVCLASHQLEDAWRWADRLVTLHDGAPAPVSPENLFRVTLPGAGGVQSVRIGAAIIEVMTDRVGPATLAVPPDEIVLSRSPLDSSARNRVAGRIVRVSEQGAAVRVSVDAGGLELVALVTRRSFDELGLALGGSVVASFKSVAVRVF